MFYYVDLLLKLKKSASIFITQNEFHVTVTSIIICRILGNEGIFIKKLKPNLPHIGYIRYLRNKSWKIHFTIVFTTGLPFMSHRQRGVKQHHKWSARGSSNDEMELL